MNNWEVKMSSFKCIYKYVFWYFASLNNQKNIRKWICCLLLIFFLSVCEIILLAVSLIRWACRITLNGVYVWVCRFLYALCHFDIVIIAFILFFLCVFFHNRCSDAFICVHVSSASSSPLSLSMVCTSHFFMSSDHWLCLLFYSVFFPFCFRFVCTLDLLTNFGQPLHEIISLLLFFFKSIYTILYVFLYRFLSIL